MTFSNDPAFVTPVVAMMMGSREAVVDYMTPLGLHHQMARGHHYGPGPWVSGGPRPDWTSVYYNRADSFGIGFDRTAAGSNAVAQYAPQVAARFGNVANTPENLRRWIQNPNAIKPGSRMPSMGLSDPDLNTVTSYLETLR